jgi:DNA polymerase-3 subunit beta
VKITTNQSSLLHCLDKVSGVTQGTVINPIFANVLLQAAGSSLSMTAIDQEMQIMSSCNVETDAEFGITVPAKKLQDIIRKLEKGMEVSLVFEEEKNDGGEKQLLMQLTAGRGKYKLQTLSAENFPLMGKSTDIKPLLNVQAKTLLESLRQVHYASAQQSHRTNLNGVFLESSIDGLRFVATDGHRLAMKVLTPEKMADDAQLILPRKSVNELIRNLSAEGENEIKIEAGNRVVRFCGDTFELTSNIIMETFPDYRSVIPRNNDKIALVERRSFLASLQRVSVLAEERGATVIVSLSPEGMKLECVNKENESAVEETDAKYENDAIKLCFNINFLLDILSAVEEDVFKMRLLEESSSVLIEPAGDGEPSFQYVVMPVRM